jgi:hypothetical protein
MIGVLELPQNYDFLFKQATEGEVKGKEIESKNPSPRKFSPTPSPSPHPSLTPAPTLLVSEKPSLSPTPSPQIEKIVTLLDKKVTLKNEKLELKLPSLNMDQLLYVEFDLISVENLLGFDEPGFTLKVDDQLAYQQLASETGTKIISFTPFIFSNQPLKLTFWSGNTGDNLNDTYAIIKNIRLIINNGDFIETEPINDLVMTVDNDNHSTIEWTSPDTNDQKLTKALAYEIRYSPQPLTVDNWAQSPEVEIVLPKSISPHFPKTKEVVLVKTPSINAGYLAIRSFNSMGSLSPLGKSVSFTNLDD